MAKGGAADERTEGGPLSPMTRAGKIRSAQQELRRRDG